jgi:hypothetical protein
MATYYVIKGKRGGWVVTLGPDALPMPGGCFKTRREALTVARLLAGWRGSVVA